MQKSALRCILGDSYTGYKDALEKLSLEERREQMCLKFAKQCLKLEKKGGLAGGGLAGQIVTLYKFVFKIHFKPF